MNNIEKSYLFYKKALILLFEGKKDLDVGCYNKTISTFYFAVDAIVNVIFAIKKQKTRGLVED